MVTEITAEQASKDLYGGDVTGGSQELIYKVTANISMDRNTNPDVKNVGGGEFTISIDETQFENTFTTIISGAETIAGITDKFIIQKNEEMDGYIDYAAVALQDFDADFGGFYIDLGLSGPTMLTYIDQIDFGLDFLGNPSADEVPSELDIITYYLNPLDTETDISITYDSTYKANIATETITVEVTGVQVDIMK